MGYVTKHPRTMLGLRLQRARLNTRIGGKYISQQKMANLLGVSKETYWRWETGRYLPTEKGLKRIATILGIAEDELWLDALHLPPDMQEFLVTTREGAQVVKNIRRIMAKLESEQQPTTRRGIPEYSKVNDTLLHRLRSGETMTEARERKKRQPESAPETIDTS